MGDVRRLPAKPPDGPIDTLDDAKAQLAQDGEAGKFCIVAIFDEEWRAQVTWSPARPGDLLAGTELARQHLIEALFRGGEFEIVEPDEPTET